jgi:hypothetical protein
LELKELEKILCLVCLFGLIAPVLGILMKGRPTFQAVLFVTICVMIPSGVFKPQEWGLTLCSLDEDIQFYRGHATGFHFYFVEALAFALVIARAFEDWRDFRLLPPGLWLYFLHCGLCFLSIINAPSPLFVYMAAVKAVKISVILMAGYNFFSSQRNIHIFLWGMALAIGIELFAALRQRYVLGIYQCTGTFEHQNSLSMFVTLIGMVYLAAALGPKTWGVNFYLLVYLACGFIEESTFSRAGMVMFALGSAAVALLSIIDKFTIRRLCVLSALAVMSLVALAMSIDTIRGRFNDYGNDASEMTRQLLNQAARNMVHDYPLGIGWNNFAMVINQPFPYGNIIDEWELEVPNITLDPNHQKGIVESIYYLLLAETGWQGVGSFILFMLIYLWWNFRNALFYRYSFLGALNIGIAVGCGCNYIQSTLERILIQPRNQMLWFLLLALTARIYTWRRTDARLRWELKRVKEMEAVDAETEALSEPAPAGAGHQL